MNLPANITHPATAGPWRTGFTLLLTALAVFPLFAASEEETAPPLLEARRLDGTSFALGDSRGAVTVVAVWSPESLASRKSLGELQRFAALHQSSDMNVIAISTLEDAEQLQRFANDRQLVLPLAVMGKTSLGPFPEQTLPHIYVFDRNGKLHGFHRGLFRLHTIEQLVAPLR